MTRYVARPTGFRDGLGLPDYAVIDTRHDAVEETWSGYFAEQDARAAAQRLNEEGKDHDRQEGAARHRMGRPT